MINLANAVGRVMMAAVTLPRSNKTLRETGMETYVKTEFKQTDQAYVMDCMRYGRRIDVRNITV
jgi:hypothetical protein